jgi:carboxylesterase type B
LLAFFHGSSFVLCSLDTHDGMCRHLCAGAGCVVVSVDYRLAPEHKYPAGLDDCVFATRWIADHAAELDGDAGRIAVAGDSAGGNLAAAAALCIRDLAGPRLIPRLLLLGRQGGQGGRGDDGVVPMAAAYLSRGKGVADAIRTFRRGTGATRWPRCR